MIETVLYWQLKQGDGRNRMYLQARNKHKRKQKVVAIGHRTLGLFKRNMVETAPSSSSNETLWTFILQNIEIRSSLSSTNCIRISYNVWYDTSFSHRNSWAEKFRCACVNCQFIIWTMCFNHQYQSINIWSNYVHLQFTYSQQIWNESFRNHINSMVANRVY